MRIPTATGGRHTGFGTREERWSSASRSSKSPATGLFSKRWSITAKKAGSTPSSKLGRHRLLVRTFGILDGGDLYRRYANHPTPAPADARRRPGGRRHDQPRAIGLRSPQAPLNKPAECRIL